MLNLIYLIFRSLTDYYFSVKMSSWILCNIKLLLDLLNNFLGTPIWRKSLHKTVSRLMWSTVPNKTTNHVTGNQCSINTWNITSKSYIKILSYDFDVLNSTGTKVKIGLAGAEGNNHWYYEVLFNHLWT